MLSAQDPSRLAVSFPREPSAASSAPPAGAETCVAELLVSDVDPLVAKRRASLG